MRWDALFGDMEAQLAAESRLALEGEISERARVETAGIGLTDRLRAATGKNLGVLLASGSVVHGVLVHVGSEWIVLNGGNHQWLVPLAAVVSCQGLGRQAQVQESRIQQRLGLASALRVLARDRAELSVYLSRGVLKEQILHGVIDRVGLDHLDLAVVMPGEPRRAGNVSAVTTLPFSSVSALRSPAAGNF